MSGDNWDSLGGLKSAWGKYRRSGIAEARPWEPTLDLTGVSISDEDRIAGSPKWGDMIARNPDNRSDMWLIAEAYFEKNFEVYHVPGNELELNEMVRRLAEDRHFL